MIIKELDIKDVYKIQIEPIYDNRGNFKRTYDKLLFKEYGIDKDWVQENHSYTLNKYTIRGLHFQFPPHSETKLVRVVNGTIYDVFVDLRKDSDSFGKYGSIILSSDNNKMLLIPRGFAHGYCTLTDNCDVLYKVDNYYTPTKECGIIWNDKDLNIDWRIDKQMVSKKDSNLMTLKEFIKKFESIDINNESKKTMLLYKDKNLD